MQDAHDRRPPTIFWLRRDLQLGDHPGWHAALGGAGPVIPVFVLDPIFTSYGAAPKWRLGESLADLGAALERRGSRLVLRHGQAAGVLDALGLGDGRLPRHLVAPL